MRPVYAIITAAGSGVRLGCEGPKALVTVAGSPLVRHAVKHLAGLANLCGMVVTAPADAMADFAAVLNDFPVHVVAGGNTRQASVHRGLEALAELYQLSNAIVLVHDAARAFAPTAVAQRVVDAVNAGASAVVPALPAVDTMRVVKTGDIPGTECVTADLDRGAVRLVQTPQGFPGELLLQAHREATVGDTTDDASLVAHLGHSIHVVPGDFRALKVTYPSDIVVVEQIIKSV